MDGCDLQITLRDICLARWCHVLLIPSAGLWKETGTGTGLKLGSLQAQGWPIQELKMFGPAITHYSVLLFSLPSRR